MPITWLRHRPVFALLLFPWIPPLPLSFPATQPPAVAVEADVAKEPTASAPEEPLVLPGVVIEEIPKGSALEKAGLQVGDVILSWERLPNPPANPEGARGELTSYFDWMELEIEQAPRGAVVLRGRRGEEPLELRVELGLWEVEVRPALSRALEKIYFTGKAQLASGNIEAAAQAWGSIDESLAKECGRDLPAWIALRIGNAWREKIEWEKAADSFQEALKVAQSPQAQIVALSLQGHSHLNRNAYQAAIEAYASALAIRERAQPNSLVAAKILNNLGIVLSEQGDLSQAQKYHLRALEITERNSPESLSIATILNNLGLLAWEEGDLDKAQTYHNRDLQILEKWAPHSLETATSLNNLGLVAWARGDLANAERYFLRTLKLDQELSPQSLDMATSLSNLGSIALHRGEPNQARKYYLQALQIEQTLAPQSLQLALSFNNLGAVAMDQGDLGEAENYYRQAHGIKARLAPESLEVATSLNNLGNVASERGDLKQAREYLLRALYLLEKLVPQSLYIATNLNSLGAVAWEQGDLDKANEYFARALQIREKIAPTSISAAGSLLRLGNVARARSQIDLAHDYYSRSLKTLEYQVTKLGGSYHVQTGFRAQHAEYYHTMMDFLLTQSLFTEAFNLLERFRGQTFLTMVVERDTAFTKDIPEELDRERRRLGVLYDRILRRLAGLNPQDNSQEIEAIRLELQSLDSEAGYIEYRIRQASPRLAALQYPQPLGVNEAQQALDSGTLLLSYSVGKEKTVLFALSHSGDLEVKTLPLGEKALRSQVTQLLSLIRESRVDSSIGKQRRLQLQRASQDLYSALLGPVEERIAASERLLILPDGPLHVLPFGALLHDGQYLANWKPLHIALSVTVFAELKQRHQSNAPQAPIQLAAFGDPVYPQSLKKKGYALDDSLRGDPTVRSVSDRGLFDWQPLPYTRREVEGIAHLFPTETTKTFLGPEALEDKVKSLDPKTRILHIAAHGHTDEHLPSSSFLALTIPEDTGSDAVTPQHDNGLLQVWEIFERVRLDADLVVLSACETGLGEEQGGEGLIGLTRAFQYAGARTVMASLWNVQDRATSELMIRFYKHLRAGLPKDEALRQAQIELIRGPIEVIDEEGEKILMDASAPYYWAGFQLYGDWQ